ncbi:MAG TPA: ABC transporter ATP-binding protein [Chloroflexota bacterium]|nr:ABC transporter ATP-binding protein [Chloroflexota bacterium]
MAIEPLLHLATTKRLREFTLSVDLAFGAGVTAIVGPSGAGKSTLLRMVAGLMPPDSGTITLGGRLLDDAARGYHLAPGRRDVSMVFQEYALFPHLSVAANVAYGLQARHVTRTERRRRTGEMLERLGIGLLAGERPGRLSGGQRQRVALARALIVRPSALLLDEPLGSLDIQTRATVRQELRAVLRDLAIPTLLVTHDYADALVFRERIVILAAGQVAQDGSHADLLAHPRSRFVADFTGVNFYEGTLEAHEPDRSARVRLQQGIEINAAADGVAPGPVSLSLQPWELTLSLSPPEGSARNTLAGRVREVLPLGGRVRVVLAAGPGETLPLVAEITPEAQASLHCREGQLLYASFKATAVRVTPQ